MDNYKILKFIYAKHNELDSMKKYISDDLTIKIIEAKQDTLSDMEKLIKNEITSDILDV